LEGIAPATLLLIWLFVIALVVIVGFSILVGLISEA
jgi:hypothetical protein